MKVGARIDKDLVKATLPLKPNRAYKINIQALSSRAADFADSPFSNPVSVTTSMTTISSQFLLNNTNANALSSGGLLPINNVEMLLAMNASSGSKMSMQDPVVASLRHYYEKENANMSVSDAGAIQVRIKKLTEDLIELEWSLASATSGSVVKKAVSRTVEAQINEYKVEWHCLNNNERYEQRLGPNATAFVVRKLRSGFTYCVRVCGIRDANTSVARSRNLLVQMCAAPDAPQLALRACNFKYVTMEWQRPASYGDADIVGYKLYVDGKVEAVVSAEQHVYTLSSGEPCREYKFQVQAVTSDESISSPMSAPLVVVWPGILLPNLREIDNDSGSGGSVLRLAWDEPVVTGNLKLAFYRVVTECEQTGERDTLGPLDINIQVNTRKHSNTN